MNSKHNPEQPSTEGCFLLQVTRLLLVISAGFLTGCFDKAQNEISAVEKRVWNPTILDSIQLFADTGYVRNIGATEFHLAEQYFDREKNISSKVMRDTGGNVIALVQFIKDVRILYAEYYSNGQLKGSLPLNDHGAFHGYSKYYYPDGRVRSEGTYQNGLFSGKWKNYDETGILISTEEYDANGQVLRIRNKE